MKNYLKYAVFASAAAAVLVGAVVLAQGPWNIVAQHHAPVCPGPASEGTARCHARVVVDADGLPKAQSLPAGYNPADFHGAYTSVVNAPMGQIIAIVDAYDHPKILTDLNTYSSTFGISGLTQCSGPVASSSVPCFKKVDQRGGNTYPKADAGWALEIALDVEMAHAMCQNCSILLVEADSNSYTNLMAAVDRAIILGVNVISNSYGSSEFSGERAVDSHFNHQGIAITFSSGDSGYGVDYPAASPYVTAVGGTSLYLNPDKSWKNETVWSGTGSGCSAYEARPFFQTDLFDPLCSNRTVADVSADADPNTGAAVYDSVRYLGRQGWFTVGGTSLAAPLVAGVYALAGSVPANAMGNSLPYYYNSPLNLHDVTSGSNGSCGNYLCRGALGYDGPTGLGTPNGLGAF